LLVIEQVDVLRDPWQIFLKKRQKDFLRANGIVRGKELEHGNLSIKLLVVAKAISLSRLE